MHFVLHGWPAEENTPEELRFYRTKREKSTFKSRKFNPIVQRGFEVGETVMVKDFRNRGSAGTKGFVQDRLGPVFKLESFFGKDISINYVN